MKSLGILPPEKELLAEEKELSPSQKKFRRLVVIVIAVFLLLLLVGYFVFGDVWHVIEGKVGSYNAEDYAILVSSEGYKVIFSKEVYDTMLDAYLENQETEVAFCLGGELKEGSYYMESFYIPPTRRKEVFSVTSEICDSSTLIAFHTHPYKSCIFSEADINYYKAFSKINPDGMIGLMCEPNRFTFYKE